MIVKARGISDEDFLRALAADAEQKSAEWGIPVTAATRWSMKEHLPLAPDKVVLAKAKALIRRKVIDGCTCGCRGDFTIP